jgi:hypothetical protein
MRGPRLTDWDRALLVIWALIALPIVVSSGWLRGALLPAIWTGSPLLIRQFYDGALLLLVYGLPIVIIARIVARALR